MAPAQKHRDGLIEAAMTLFRRQGYAATGLAEILSESGAPKGSLYHYFPDGKEAIAEAALQHATAQNGAWMRPLFAAAPNPAALIRTIGDVMAAQLAESGFCQGCPIATLALEAAPQSDRLTRASRDAFALWSAAVARALTHAGLPDTRATTLADFIISGFEGALILARVRQDTTPVLRAADELARLLESELPPTRSPS
jgi:TetR/AcrR family transcriptional repressor of lmrAB and yxaGH operons